MRHLSLGGTVHTGNRNYRMKQPAGQYVLSFQAERFYKYVRYHWMVCCEHKPDELVSWGHAPTQELAEAAARNEVKDLSSGLSHRGRVSSTSTSFVHHH